MLIALCTLPGKEDEHPRLCLVPEKLSSSITPVNLAFAVATEAAIHFLSPDEGFVVKVIEEGFREISPLAPARLYLTPNLPSSPGFAVSKIKYKILSDTKYQVFYDRSRGWEKWEPLTKSY